MVGHQPSKLRMSVRSRPPAQRILGCRGWTHGWIQDGMVERDCNPRIVGYSETHSHAVSDSVWEKFYSGKISVLCMPTKRIF